MKRQDFILVGVMFVLLLLIAIALYYKDASEVYVAINENYFRVEIADSSEEREKGLMFREFLEENSGMLFIFEDSNVRGFWMKNTKIPLDIIYIDESMKIINIVSAEPCFADICPSYYSDGDAKYVLEINKGQAEKLGIKEGNRIIIL